MSYVLNSSKLSRVCGKGLSLAIAVAAMGACRETPSVTEYVPLPSAVLAHPSQNVVRTIEFEMIKESHFAGRPNPRTQRVHVRRTTDEEGGHHTTITFRGDTLFASSPSYSQRLSRIEIDREGKATAFRADESQRSLPADARNIALNLAAASSAPDSVRTRAAVVAAATPEGVSIGETSGAWIDQLVSSPEQRSAAVKRTTAEMHLERGNDGVDRYISSRGDQSAELSLDPKTNLVLGVTFSQNGREFARASYAYLELGQGLYLRTHFRLTRTGEASSGSQSSSVVLSNVSVNGEEVGR